MRNLTDLTEIERRNVAMQCMDDASKMDALAFLYGSGSPMGRFYHTAASEKRVMATTIYPRE